MSVCCSRGCKSKRCGTGRGREERGGGGGKMRPWGGRAQH